MSFIPSAQKKGQVRTGFIRLWLAGVMAIIASACTTATDERETVSGESSKVTSNPKPRQLPVVCLQPAPVKDIWRLEPILVQSGDISGTMTQAEKERVIRAYIARRYKQYELCLRGKKG